MKTPWRFISDLVSRKSADDRPAGEIAKTSDVVAIEHHPEEKAQLSSTGAVERPVDETETNSTTLEIEGVNDAPALPAVGGDVVEQSLLTVETDATAEPEVPKPDHAREIDVRGDLTEEVALASVPKVTEAKRRGKAALAASPTDLPSDPEPVEANAETTAYDEMVKLDQEIAELRRLLSKKLIIQNAQLKTLIERY